MNNNAEIKNTGVDFNTLSYLEESINTYYTNDKSEYERNFSTYISDFDSLVLNFPQDIFCSTSVSKK